MDCHHPDIIVVMELREDAESYCVEFVNHWCFMNFTTQIESVSLEVLSSYGLEEPYNDDDNPRYTLSIYPYELVAFRSCMLLLVKMPKRTLWLVILMTF